MAPKQLILSATLTPASTGKLILKTKGR